MALESVQAGVKHFMVILLLYFAAIFPQLCNSNFLCKECGFSEYVLPKILPPFFKFMPLHFLAVSHS
jgi:hypothetical protein